MKKVFALVLLVLPVVAFGDRDPRVGTTSMVNSKLAPRMGFMFGNQVTTPDNSISVDRSPSVKAELVAPGVKVVTKKDDVETARSICLNNNVGVGNTFVWASKYSDPSNYSTMQEDINNPENNVCFARVELKTSDSKIDMSGIPARYFQWGERVECGAWVDENLLKKRILDGKKTGRVLATVGASVGGAALGVGAMEAFGNKLIGGKVMGQKGLANDTAKLRSQLLVLKKDNPSKYQTYLGELRELRIACEKLKLQKLDAWQSSKCSVFDYDLLLNELS